MLCETVTAKQSLYFTNDLTFTAYVAQLLLSAYPAFQFQPYFYHLRQDFKLLSTHTRISI